MSVLDDLPEQKPLQCLTMLICGESDQQDGHWYGPAKVREIAAAVEAETIRRCAAVCAEIATDKWAQYKGRPPHGNEHIADPHTQGESFGAEECEKTILAMLEERLEVQE